MRSNRSVLKRCVHMLCGHRLAGRLRIIPVTFGAVTTVSALVFSLQPAAAYEHPWCAVIQNSTESVYWDCQYSSIEQCRSTVLAGNRGWCNPNPYFVAYGAATNKHHRKHRAHPQ